MLALYELGTSFRFGWGVEKDKRMVRPAFIGKGILTPRPLTAFRFEQAVSYFQLAADMGDPDAQSDLAFCYANGKGTKKDMKKAAKVCLVLFGPVVAFQDCLLICESRHSVLPHGDRTGRRGFWPLVDL